MAMHSTLNIPISEGCTNSSHTHNLANFQSYRGPKLLMRDTKFMTTVYACSPRIGRKLVHVCG